MFTVLHTESSMGWGGQENRTLRECIGLRKLGVRPIILCQPDATLGKKAAAEGIEVRTCRMRKSYDLFALRSILALIRKENIDVVNTHSGRDSLLAGIAGRLSRKRPIIVRTRHLALPITSRFTYGILPHKVVTVSEYVRDYLISEGISPERVISIPTGVDLNRFDLEKTEGALRRELGLDERTPVVGTIAVLRIKKGHQILLDAVPRVLQEIPDAVFVFAGDGPQRENITNKIKDLDLSGRVFMLGQRSDIPGILKSIDLFVLPTLQEALGTSFLEAMAMERPVIGSAVDGVGEVVKHGKNGRLVEPRNPAMLAEAIIEGLKDREKSKAMGKEGREMVRQNYTVEKMCEGMYFFYSSLLEERRR